MTSSTHYEVRDDVRLPHLQLLEGSAFKLLGVCVCVLFSHSEVKHRGFCCYWLFHIFLISVIFFLLLFFI